MAEIALLGIFEDAGQRDFHAGLIENVAEREGLSVVTEPRVTDGCRFDFLQVHLSKSPYFNGVVIGVDGKQYSPDEKVVLLRRGLTDRSFRIEGINILWGVAIPSIEEWLTADKYALPEVIRKRNKLAERPTAHRPGGASTEQTAKSRLREWTRRLSGADPLRGGLEYAFEVGRILEPERVGSTRNPDLREFVRTSLPSFLNEL